MRVVLILRVPDSQEKTEINDERRDTYSKVVGALHGRSKKSRQYGEDRCYDCQEEIDPFHLMPNVTDLPRTQPARLVALHEA